MKKVFVGFLAFALCSCSDSTSSASVEPVDISPDESHAEMMLVKASGKSTTLGSNRSSKTDEFPKMKVLFSYDFSIGKHEVTCDEYNAFAMHPQDCSGDIPVTNVTYFDAVLFANEKSKADGLDTAYEYASAVFGEAGNCTDLGGIVFYPERNAYRLPTEAEWVLVASQDFRPSASWNANNSDYKPHPVCSVEGRSEICDMAGNAMEWVSDWKGSFRDTVLVNFAGGSDGGSLGERVLKGGSFRNAPSVMTLYSRGDVYAVTSSTFADYVGFRLALGKIPDAVYLDKNGLASDSPVRIKASSNDLKSKLGTYRSKLVFRKDDSGNLAFVNYGNASLSVTEIPDTIDAYHPTISPDGKRVAFCTRPEGISGRSDLYVRDLDAKGSNLARLEAESAAIPRWRVVGADTQIVYVTGAGNNADAAEWKRGSTWAVPFSGGKFGTPEKLFDGTYNGGVSSDGRLAVSGARLLRANADGKESVWYSGEQACNASLSDSTKRTLFLDFGGETGKSFAGKSYDAHEMLLIADSSGKLSEMVPSPASYAFDHTEWVRGREDLAVATLTDADGAHAKIALIDVADSSVLELAEGRELWHPDLWVSNFSSQNAELDPDSAGVYLTGEHKTVSDFFVTRYDLELLYKYRDSITVLISGSSRPWGGIYPPYLNSLTNEFSINASNAAVDIQVAKRILLEYGKNLCPKLKVIVFSLDLDIFFQRYYANPNFWEALYAKVPGYAYDVNHDFWKDGYPNGLYELTKDSYGSDDSERKRYENTLGFFQNQAIDWGGDPELAADSTQMDGVENLPDSLLAVPLEIIREAEKNGIYAIGIIFPQSPKYAKTGAFGRYGLRRSVAEQIIEKLQEFEKKYPHFRLMDENKMGYHDYTDTMAMNWDHLAPLGASKLTARLADLLKTLE